MVDRRTQIGEPGDDRAVCPGGYVDVERSLHRRRDHPGPHRGIAAARNREAFGYRCTEGLVDQHVDGDTHEMTCLVGATDIVRLSFDPQVHIESSCVGKP